MQRVAVIMAGGSGDRFWPLSRKARPKQLLPLASETESLLAQCVRRISALIPRGQVFVQTMPHLVAPIQAANLGIPDENVLAEPLKRNTAGCLCYAAAHMRAHFDDDVSMAVLSADPLIEDEALYLATVDAALKAAEADPLICTIGVIPDRPATGYGYIHAEVNGSEAPLAALPVKEFREKPSREVAEQYVADGSYFWNSGMFFWRLSTFQDELTQASPAFGEATTALAEAMRRNDEEAVERVFAGLESVAIDYALMEKARKVAVVRASFTWDDVGTWSALERTRPADAEGNIVEGDPVLANCRNSVVCNTPGGAKMAVGVVGMEDVIVVTTEDAVLVVHKNHTEDVKQVVNALRERGAKQL